MRFPHLRRWPGRVSTRSCLGRYRPSTPPGLHWVGTTTIPTAEIKPMPKPLTSQPPEQARGGHRPRSAPSNPDIVVRLTPTLEDPFQLVVVSKHIPDWGTSVELLEETEARIQMLGNRISNGTWFLNPRFTVHASAPSAEFFRDARHARSEWLKEVRGSISLQRESRSVVARARRIALADLDLAGTEPPPLSPPPARVTPQERLEARQFGHIAKQLTFSGIIFIEGEYVLPRTWNALADQLLGPERLPRRRPRQRHEGHAGSASRRWIAPTNPAICSQEERQP